MQISVINSFDQDVLMLVSHTNTHYHKRVLIQVGSRVIDQIVKSLMEEELKSSSQSWKLAYVINVLSKSLQVSDEEFDYQVKGKVAVTKKVIIPAFQTKIVKGLTRITGHQKCIHVLVEPSPKFVPGNSTELK